MSARFEDADDAAEFINDTLGAWKKKNRPAAGATFWKNRDDTWDEAKIPMRRWIAQRYLMVGKVSLLVGTPAAGKSLLALQWGIALCLDAPLGDFKPTPLPGEQARCRRVLILNAEDDDEEQKRRISALIRPFGRKPADLDGNLIRIGPQEVATLFERNEDGDIVDAQGMKDLRNIIREDLVDVVILDPLAELMTGVDENSNGDINTVMARLRSLAIEENVAILVVHHTRKGNAAPGSLETARGASSLGGSVRVALTLSTMTEEEASKAGISLDSRKHYSRLDDAKQSYTSMGDAAWFEKQGILLANGDSAPMLSPWALPKDIITPEIRVAIEAGIARGINGEPWSPRLTVHARSVKHLMIQHGVTTGAGQKALLANLLQDGFEDAVFKDRGASRHKQHGLRTPRGEPSSVAWEGAE
jgi:hypothetical protein